MNRWSCLSLQSCSLPPFTLIYCNFRKWFFLNFGKRYPSAHHRIKFPPTSTIIFFILCCWCYWCYLCWWWLKERNIQEIKSIFAWLLSIGLIGLVSESLKLMAIETAALPCKRSLLPNWDVIFLFRWIWIRWETCLFSFYVSFINFELSE